MDRRGWCSVGSGTDTFISVELDAEGIGVAIPTSCACLRLYALRLYACAPVCLCACMSVRWHAVRLYVSTPVRLYACTPLRLYGCTSVWLLVFASRCERVCSRDCRLIRPSNFVDSPTCLPPFSHDACSFQACTFRRRSFSKTKGAQNRSRDTSQRGFKFNSPNASWIEAHSAATISWRAIQDLAFCH